ncbi:hypothetical protein MFRU_032g00590 [Monilinia fructicola]|nr:hypothetical protein MFRU_032g00590 [Monilinia fructicola]
MKISDFLIAMGWLITSTNFSLSQHQELLEMWNLPSFIINPSITTILAPLSENPSQASELMTIVSKCISVGILARIYDVGQREKLHAPMFVLAFGASVFLWTKIALPIDIYLFVVFPWIMMIGLLISRMNAMVWGMEDQSVSEKTSSSSMLELVPGL